MPNQDIPTFDGQALGGSLAAWTAKLQELATTAQKALQNNDDATLKAAQQALEAYSAWPCPDGDLRDKADALLDNLSLTVIARILKQLQDLPKPVRLAATEQTFQPTSRQRLLNAVYTLQALRNQHAEEPFRHRYFKRQLDALLTTTQALLDK